MDDLKELAALRREYEEEVISHDIEEKDLRRRLAEGQKRIEELEQQVERLKDSTRSILYSSAPKTELQICQEENRKLREAYDKAKLLMDRHWDLLHIAGHLSECISIEQWLEEAALAEKGVTDER